MHKHEKHELYELEFQVVNKHTSDITDIVGLFRATSQNAGTHSSYRVHGKKWTEIGNGYLAISETVMYLLYAAKVYSYL